MLELCPKCGALLKPEAPHACDGSAAPLPDLALDVAPPAPTAVAGVRTSVAPGAAPLTWRWELPDGRSVVLEIDSGTRAEAVRLGERIVSRSGPGGAFEGHAFSIRAPSSDAADARYRTSAAPGEALVRFHPARHAATLTLDGLLIAPLTQPPPPVRPAGDPLRGAFVRAPYVDPSPRAIVGSLIALAVLVVVCLALGGNALLVLLGIGGLVWFGGWLALRILAFHEGIGWGLLCLFVPGAAVVFIVTHWDQAKAAAAVAYLGAAVLVIGVVAAIRAMPARRAEVTPVASAPAQEDSCPSSERPPLGFATWCCARGGWRVVYDRGCTSVYKPSDACDESAPARTTVAACSTLRR